MVCASTEATEYGIAFLLTERHDVGLLATDRPESRCVKLLSLKPEVGDLEFLVVAVAKCEHTSQGNVDLAIGGEAVDNSEHSGFPAGRGERLKPCLEGVGGYNVLVEWVEERAGSKIDEF